MTKKKKSKKEAPKTKKTADKSRRGPKGSKSKPAAGPDKDQGKAPGPIAFLAGRKLFSSPLAAWAAVALFMLVGLGFRLSTTLWQPIIFPDSMQYMHLAREIRSGEFLGADYDLEGGFIKSRRLPPLYSFLIAPFAGTQADLEKVGIILSLAISTLTLIPLFLAARRAFPLGAALAATGLLSFNVFALKFAYPILSESTFTFLFTATLAAALWAFSQQTPRRLVVAGLVCGALSGLLYMTRDVGVTAAPLIAAGAVVKLKLVDRRPWSRAALLSGAVILAFMLTSTPYFAHIRARTGGFGLTAQMDNTSITKQVRSRGGDRWDRDRLGGEQIKDLAVVDKGCLIGSGLASQQGTPAPEGISALVMAWPRIAMKTLRNLRLYGLQLLQRCGPFATALMLIALIGMAGDYYRTRRADELFLRAWVAFWLVQLLGLYSLVTPYMVDDRYMYPLVPPLLLLAGYGIHTGAAWFTGLAGREERSSDRSGANGTGRWLAPVAIGLFAMVAGLILFEYKQDVSGASRLACTPGGGALMAAVFGAGCGALGAAIGIVVNMLRKGPGLRTPSTIAAALAVAFYVIFIPDMIHRDVNDFIRVHLNGDTSSLYYAYYIGAVVLATLSMGLLAWWIINKFEDARSSVVYAIIFYAVAVSIALMAKNDFVLSLYRLVLDSPGPAAVFFLLVHGFAIAFLCLSAAGRLLETSKARSIFLAAICSLLLMAAFFTHLVDYRALKSREANIKNKYSAGHKQVGLILKENGLVPAGKVVCSRKPFMAYYLDGEWYRDKKETIPQTIGEVEELAASGKIDYVVVDTFVCKTLRKKLMHLALHLRPRLLKGAPLKGARMIYSKYLEEWQEEPPPKFSGERRHLDLARRYYVADNLPAAFRETAMVIGRSPDNAEAWGIRTRVLRTYFLCARRGGIPTRIYIPELLPMLAEAAAKNYQLSPRDPEAKSIYDNVKSWSAIEERMYNDLLRKHRR